MAYVENDGHPEVNIGGCGGALLKMAQRWHRGRSMTATWAGQSGKLRARRRADHCCRQGQCSERECGRHPLALANIGLTMLPP